MGMGLKVFSLSHISMPHAREMTQKWEKKKKKIINGQPSLYFFFLHRIFSIYKQSLVQHEGQTLCVYAVINSPTLPLPLGKKEVSPTFCHNAGKSLLCTSRTKKNPKKSVVFILRHAFQKHTAHEPVMNGTSRKRKPEPSANNIFTSVPLTNGTSRKTKPEPSTNNIFTIVREINVQITHKPLKHMLQSRFLAQNEVKKK